jgi:hypothetical protein
MKNINRVGWGVLCALTLGVGGAIGCEDDDDGGVVTGAGGAGGGGTGGTGRGAGGAGGGTGGTTAATALNGHRAQ